MSPLDVEDDAVADAVNDLLFEHVVAGRHHPSVVAETLPSYIEEILNAARREDWQAVADELIRRGARDGRGGVGARDRALRPAWR